MSARLKSVPVPTEPASPAEKRSALVFSGFLLLIFVAVAFPEMSSQGLLGILWTVAGGLMLLRPPEVRVPRLWVALALGFVVFAAAGFLPRTWFQLSPWRIELEKLGLDTGPYGFLQPQLAAEYFTGFAITAIVAVYLLGHRVGTRLHQWFMLAFAYGVAIWTIVALINHQDGTIFGFFPNRNHSATLLALGAFAGLGSLAQAIRFREGWKIALSVLPQSLCLFTLFAVSESRGGMVIAVTGFFIWIILTGTRHLSGNAGKAVVLLLIAFVGLFLIIDSKVKNRLTETAERIESTVLTPEVSVPPPALADPSSAAPSTPEISFAETAPAANDLPLDGRIPIYQDTLEMAKNEPWTGVGPGQFAQVFPQHRNAYKGFNDSRCVHPESDWLQMLTETGWPATLCLIAGVAWVCATAIRRAWPSGARALRMGSVMGAMTVCLHGIFDVPGHRVGLAWAALVLMALALRPPRSRGDHQGDPFASSWTRLAWRWVGLLPLVIGLALLQAHWRGSPLLPSAKVHHLMTQAVTLYQADQAAYEEATASGRDYQPPAGNDPLEAALKLVDRALQITPLDPHLHFVRGSLALHYDDKTDIADQAFAIQRRLVPTHVNLAVAQARAGLRQTPERALSLWQEAMRRAAAETARNPKSHFGTINTYQQALQAAGRDESLIALNLTLAGSDPTLLVMWAPTATPALLDREAPRILPLLKKPDSQLTLFQLWTTRGTKESAIKFATDHPEMALPIK
jgi:hypothetical protein